jgi:hypothetical protein
MVIGESLEGAQTMDASPQSTIPQRRRERRMSPRLRQVQIIERAEQFGFWWQSRRQVARRLGVPDSSFRYCLRTHDQRCRESRGPAALVRFLETPEGLAFLHRLLAAVHLVFVQANDCGLRNVGWFLHLSGLDEFLPSSYGAQHAFACQMETLLAEFGQEEDQRLAAQMPPREISLCEDETFHPQICLVAIEPVSNFLVLEQYASQRDAGTWSRCLDERLVGWSVTVCQVTSDEAKALIAHAEQALGAHHSPDLFHVQQDIVHATSLALAGQTARAHQAIAEAQQVTAHRRAALTACQEQCPQSTQVSELQRQVEQAAAAEAELRQRLAACQQRQQQATEARQRLSQDYHPIDPETGRPREAEEVGQRLKQDLDQLDEIAAAAGLSASARQKLSKARRVLRAMQNTIAFFWATVATRLASWKLSPTVTVWMREELIPGLYLAAAAEKASTAAERQRLRARAEEVLARARSPDGVWGRLNVDERADLEAKARQCAMLFQRSSSCVEGRNGQLSLRHHGLHRLTPRKLGALKVIHNYLVERRDGSTAAERFFGTRPQPLFVWLLARLPLPARPYHCHREA